MAEPADPVAATSAYSEQERAAPLAARHFRWNFTVLVLDASTFFMGLAFLETTTVLPVLLHRLHGGDYIVGLSRFLQSLGFTLPAILGAHYIHGRSRHKPFLLATCALSRAGLLTLPLFFLFVADRSPGLVLGWILFVWAVFWLLDGASAVSWFDIIGKTIPARVRGRFFGAMQMLCGLGAVGSGLAVKVILVRWPYPLNFAILSAGLCAGVALSLLFLSLIREPPAETVREEERPGFAEFVRGAGPLLRRNPALRRLLAIRLLLDGGSMALPFYILFAERDLHVGLKMVGVYAMVQSAGKLVGGPLWGWVSDHMGPNSGLKGVACAVAAIPLFALAASAGPTGLLYAVFALIGAVQDGVWMVGSTALLATVVPEERPLAVGAASVLQAPGAFFGLIGGALAGGAGYTVVFGAALALSLAAAALAFGKPLGKVGGPAQ